MDMVVVKILGVVFVSIVFIVTVLLMPRIFGINDPSPRPDEAADAPPSPVSAADTPRLPAPGPAARGAVPQPSERLAKS